MNTGLCWHSFEALIEVGQLRQFLDAVRAHDARVRAWPRSRPRRSRLRPWSHTPRGTVRARAARDRKRLRLALATSPRTAADAILPPATGRYAEPSANDLYAKLQRIAAQGGAK
jgi:hypothetical protein